MMTIRTRTGAHGAAPMAALAIGLLMAAFPSPADAGRRDRVGARVEDGRFCSATASALDAACRIEAEAEEARARAICINVSDAAERAECFADADDADDEAEDLCAAQLAARRAACARLGEGRYDPEFGPAGFDDDFRNLTRPNRYFPLGIGNRWVYGGSESVTFEILDRTKLIEGVTCIVARDTVREDGVVVEDTNDWFAQSLDGAVFYCGEETSEFETFAGDDPVLPELVSIEGSFKWGRDGDKGGILMPAQPRRGEVYREEASLGNAEDIAEIVSTTYAYGEDRDLDRLVPRALAQRFCAGDCVVTRNSSLLSPGGFELKYYAPGVGFFLEVHPDSREVLQLVGCNFDSRCTGLPTP